MKIKRLTLKDFKRFDDLTIDLGESPARVVALVGPNGCGKSSVFDAFEEKQKDFKNANANETTDFFAKFLFAVDPSRRSATYQRNDAIQIVTERGSQHFTKKSFHIRSPYRFTPKLNVSSITAQPSILDDVNRPTSSIAMDSRLEQNYQRMLGTAYDEFEKEGGPTGDQVRKKLLDRVNSILRNVLDVEISSIGNVLHGRGQLYFKKADAIDFPYQNLSSGEKEVVDLVVDLIARNSEFDDTVYCIDEPELHLNTAIQRALLIEIEKLVPENCQLWVATHSIGFLRALQDELSDKSAILDFSEEDYFQGSHNITPMKPTRANWQRIFATALDDLVGLIAPRRIVYCEGRQAPDATGTEQGLDAIVYNEVFGPEHNDTLFVSSGGSGELPKNSSLALKILSKAFLDVELLLLRDRDVLTDVERSAFLSAEPSHRMLQRREVENYLLDFCILDAFAKSRGASVDQTQYDAIVQDINSQDLKAGDKIERLKRLCAFTGSHYDLKKSLAPFIRQCASVFDELKNCVFQAAATAP